MGRSVSLFACFSTYLFFLPLAWSQTCYWPNGDVADSTYKPCFNNVGTCCYNIDDSHTDLCYDNGMCYSLYFGRKYRGACTDQSWSDGSGCAEECKDFNSDDQAILSDCADSNTCCGAADNATSCCASGGGFQWTNATFIAHQAVAATTTLTVTQTASQTTTGTPSGSSTPISTSNADAVQISTSQCNKSKVALGAGLGVPLGLSLVAAAVLAFLLRRQGRHSGHAPATTAHYPAQPSEKAQHHYDVKTEPQMRSELGTHPGVYEMGR